MCSSVTPRFRARCWTDLVQASDQQFSLLSHELRLKSRRALLCLSMEPGVVNPTDVLRFAHGLCLSSSILKYDYYNATSFPYFF